MTPLSSRTPRSRTRGLSLSLIAAATLLAACDPAVREAKASDAAAPPAAPPVPVAAVTAMKLDVAPVQVARVEAAQRVDIQPRVSGPIAAVLFREGDLVKAGQPLFQIDPSTFDAALARAKADLQLARAQETLAAGEAERARRLHAEQAIATEDAERRAAVLAEAQARRAAAEAALRAAQLERDFTLVRAPIDGRVSRALATAGNVVTAALGGGGTTLASMVSVSPLHVHFDVADRSILDRLAGPHGVRGWQARILDADGHRELARAPIDYTHHSMDAGTGTLRLRARLDAPHPRLIPGQYVRVQVDTGHSEPQLVVPDKAIGTDQGSRYVLVVDAQGQVAYRKVTVGAAHADHRVVTDGLRAGERIVVAGLMRVRPGMKVQPQLQPATGQAHAPAAGASAPSTSGETAAAPAARKHS